MSTHSPASSWRSMSSTKVTSWPPELAQPLLMPWGATKIVLLFAPSASRRARSRTSCTRRFRPSRRRSRCRPPSGIRRPTGRGGCCRSRRGPAGCSCGSGRCSGSCACRSPASAPCRIRRSPRAVATAGARRLVPKPLLSAVPAAPGRERRDHDRHEEGFEHLSSSRDSQSSLPVARRPDSARLDQPPYAGSHETGRVVHCWLAPPLQSHRTSCVPSVVDAPGSSRQRPETGLR